MYRRSGMTGGESETAMKSSGTTVYYRGSSRGSAQASEPAGGWDGGEGKKKKKKEEDDRGGELMGVAGVTGMKTVGEKKGPRREKASDEGFGETSEVETEEMGWATECGIILSASLFVLRRSHSSECHRFFPSCSVRLMPDQRSSNGESLD